MGVVGVGIELHADETGETCDRGAETADIHPEQKTGRILGKTGEQQCGRDIADDLIARNARVAQDQKEYNERYDAMTVHSKDRIVFRLTCGDGVSLGEMEG